MEGDNDWQDTMTQHRHVHNRIANRDRTSKKGGGFDAKRMFGSYKIECRSFQKMIKGNTQEPTLELFGFTEDGQGITGHISFPDALEASVILAGSRRALNKIMSNLQSSNQVESHDNDSGDEHEDQHQQRSKFEKNSFRSPKFWLRWQGNPLSGDVETESGYIVFAGNDCRKGGSEKKLKLYN
eukprot:TRINITY_DN10151_c0_g1_i1.p1 TRINITY_DN10151_c0_g1~~TRINITY_DN10151_c0_g1_i1.p1  ORF type:complete len:183 (+),score=20.83 TRINITY_DN10151_c0_g1_i1:154-702(+)